MKTFFASFSRRNGNKTFDIKKHTLSRLLDNKDVTIYWQRFRDVFTPDKEKLWDCMLLGFQKYHSILQGNIYIPVFLNQILIKKIENYCKF